MKGAGGLLDRYVLRRFAAAYGLCLFGMTMLFLVVDFMSHLDVFFDAEHVRRAGYTTMSLIGDYYDTRLPFVVTLSAPYLTLFAAVALLVSFARQNEIAPMIAAGRSHH